MTHSYSLLSLLGLFFCSTQLWSSQVVAVDVSALEPILRAHEHTAQERPLHPNVVTQSTSPNPLPQELEDLKASANKDEKLRYLLIPATWVDASDLSESNDNEESKDIGTPCFFHSDQPNGAVGLFESPLVGAAPNLRMEHLNLSDDLKSIFSIYKVPSENIRLVDPVEMKKFRRLLEISASQQDMALDPDHNRFLMWLLQSQYNSHYLLFTGLGTGPPNAIHALPCVPSPSPAFTLPKEAVTLLGKGLERTGKETVLISTSLRLVSLQESFHLDIKSISRKTRFFFHDSKALKPARIITFQEKDEDPLTFKVTIEAPSAILEDPEISLSVTVEHPLWLLGDTGLTLERTSTQNDIFDRRCFELTIFNSLPQETTIDLLNHSFNAADMPFSVPLDVIKARYKRWGRQFDLARFVRNPELFFESMKSNYVRKVWKVRPLHQGGFYEEMKEFARELRRFGGFLEIVSTYNPHLNLEIILRKHKIPGVRFGRGRASDLLIEYIKVFLEEMASERQWPIRVTQAFSTDLRMEHIVTAQIFVSGGKFSQSKQTAASPCSLPRKTRDQESFARTE